LLLVVILAILVAGVSGAQRNEPEIFTPVVEIYRLIRNHFHWSDRIDSQRLLHGALRGMVKELNDPYSEFLSPEENRQWQERLEGRFSGVGIEITLKDEKLMVVAPIEGTPAYLAGIQAGDIIIAIDGETTAGITLREAAMRIRGEVGTSVILRVLRTDEAEKDITIIRDIIHIMPVRYEFLEEGRIGYIRITRFNHGAVKALNEALSSLNPEGLDGLIIDLRNSPGGLLSAAVAIASQFVDTGVIVSINERAAPRPPFYSVGNKIPNLPLVVLINSGTASAAEIVAGAIRDHRMGVLIGERSFGKGSIQRMIEFADGSALRLTIGEYFTPLGYPVHEYGLTPDIELTEEEDPLAVAIEWLLARAGQQMPLPVEEK